MKRILFAAFIFTFATVGAFSESKLKTTTKAPKKAAVKQTALAPVPLSALFPAAPADGAVVTTAKGMMSMDAPNHDVVMVRINADGTRSHACVNNETAARAFLAGEKKSAAGKSQE
ncbi:MAG: hypothetical protein QOC81_1798 [Thermoanaerobaculia bacterium]|jgi:hypothetical protein|nr:hypothetical protein [Thermoanaerobaculia bacterium]